MSSPTFRCLQCRSTLVFQEHEHKIWYRCTRCHSSYVPIHFLTAILSEVEYNKFVYAFQQAQVKISKACPCCKTQMIKLYNVKGKHDVEACTVCQLAWLEPLEGFQMKHEEAEKNKKIVIGGETYSLLDDDPNKPYTGGAVSWLLRSLGLEKLSAKYPVVAFLIMAVILIFIFKLLFTALLSGRTTTGYSSYGYGRRFNLIRWLFH